MVTLLRCPVRHPGNNKCWSSWFRYNAIAESAANSGVLHPLREKNHDIEAYTKKFGRAALLRASTRPHSSSVARPVAAAPINQRSACALSAASSASLRNVITAILLTRYSGMITLSLSPRSSIEMWRTSVPREGRAKVVHLLADGSYLRTTSEVQTFIQRLWFLSIVIWYGDMPW